MNSFNDISRHDQINCKTFYLQIAGIKRYTHSRYVTPAHHPCEKKVNDVRFGNKLEHKTACHRRSFGSNRQ